MRFFWYWLVSPIDFWNQTLTIEQYLHNLEETRGKDTYLREVKRIETIEQELFEKSFRYLTKAVVFFLPDETEMSRGFIFKYERAGHTFVISPQPLTHLDVVEEGTFEVL